MSLYNLAQKYKKRQVSMYVSQYNYEKLERIAKNLGISKANVVNLLIEQYKERESHFDE